MRVSTAASNGCLVALLALLVAVASAQVCNPSGADNSTLCDEPSECHTAEGAVCNSGECRYPFAADGTSCRQQEGVCEQGECRDPCDPDSCSRGCAVGSCESDLSECVPVLTNSACTNPPTCRVAEGAECVGDGECRYRQAAVGTSCQNGAGQAGTCSAFGQCIADTAVPTIATGNGVFSPGEVQIRAGGQVIFIVGPGHLVFETNTKFGCTRKENGFSSGTVNTGSAPIEVPFTFTEAGSYFFTSQGFCPLMRAAVVVRSATDCVLGLTCVQPDDQCKVARCTQTGQCLIANASPDTVCRTEQQEPGLCREGSCESVCSLCEDLSRGCVDAVCEQTADGTPSCNTVQNNTKCSKPPTCRVLEGATCRIDGGCTYENEADGTPCTTRLGQQGECLDGFCGSADIRPSPELSTFSCDFDQGAYLKQGSVVVIDSTAGFRDDVVNCTFVLRDRNGDTIEGASPTLSTIGFAEADFQQRDGQPLVETAGGVYKFVQTVQTCGSFAFTVTVSLPGFLVTFGSQTIVSASCDAQVELDCFQEVVVAGEPSTPCHYNCYHPEGGHEVLCPIASPTPPPYDGELVMATAADDSGISVQFEPYVPVPNNLLALSRPLSSSLAVRLTATLSEDAQCDPECGRVQLSTPSGTASLTVVSRTPPPPPAPRPPSLTKVGDRNDEGVTSIQAVCVPPLGTEDQELRMRLTVRSTNRSFSFSAVSSNTYSFLVSNEILEPCDTYSFRCQAITEFGESQLSLPTQVTFLGVVNEPVNGNTVSIRSVLGGFVLSWRQPATTSCTSVQSYRVRYSFGATLGDNAIVEFTTTTLLRIAVPAGVQATQVAVTVAGRNRVGFSAESELAVLDLPAAPTVCNLGISSFAASDPDNGDAVYGPGDVLTIRLSENSNAQGTWTQERVQNTFAFSHRLGTFTAQWDNNGRVLSLTVTAVPDSRAPVIGLTTARFRFENEVDDDSTNLPITCATVADVRVLDTTPSVLSGSFGTPDDPTNEVTLTVPATLSTFEEVARIVGPFSVSATNLRLVLTVTVFNGRLTSQGFINNNVERSNGFELEAEEEAFTLTLVGGELSATVIYTPRVNFNGADLVRWRLFAQASATAPRILLDEKRTQLTVAPVNDPPRLEVVREIEADGSSYTKVCCLSNLRTGIVASDSADVPIGFEGDYKLFIFSANGRLLLNISESDVDAQLRVSPTPGTETRSVELRGPLYRINRAVSNLLYRIGEDEARVDSDNDIVLELSDQGNVGRSPTLRNDPSLTASARIRVSAVCRDNVLTNAVFPITATFSADLSTILVEFEPESAPLRNSNNDGSCEPWIPAGQVDEFFASFGAGVQCRRTSLTTLVIVLGRTSTPARPGDALSLRGRIERCDGDPVGVLYRGTIQRPPIILPPSVRIIGPRVIPPCRVLRLAVEISGAGAARPTIVWRSSTGTLDGRSADDLDDATLRVPPSDFSDVMRFTVTVSTRFNTSASASVTVRRLPPSSPAISPVGPLEYRLCCDCLPRSLFVRASLPECIAQSSDALTYSWTVTEVSSGSTVSGAVSTTNEFPIARRLSLLPPGEYAVTATVCLRSNSTRCASVNFVFIRETCPFEIELRGGDRRETSVTSQITLQVINADGTQFTGQVREWECQQLGGGACVNLTSQTDLDIGALVPGDEPGTFQSRVTFDAAVIGSNVFRFTVTALEPASGQIAMASQLWVVSAGEKPDVFVLGPRIVSPTAVFALRAVARPSEGAASIDSFLWTVPDAFADFVTTLDQSTLVVSGALSDVGFPIGEATFIVEATDSAGLSAESTIIVTVNAPPSGGSLDCSPLVGVAYSTEFTFQANGFTDPDTPLLYTFGYRGRRGRFVPLTEATRSNVFSTARLPAGIGGSNNLTIGVIVRDALNARAFSSCEITINRNNTISLTDLTNLVLNEADSVRESTQDASDVLSAVQGLAETLLTSGDSISSSERQAVRQRLATTVRDSASILSPSLVVDALISVAADITDTDAQFVAESIVAVRTSFSQRERDGAEDDESTLAFPQRVFTLLSNLIRSLGLDLQSAGRRTQTLMSVAPHLRLQALSTEAQAAVDTYETIDEVFADLTNNTLVAAGQIHSFNESAFDAAIERVVADSINTNQFVLTDGDDEIRVEFPVDAVEGVVGASAFVDIGYVVSDENPFAFGGGVDGDAISKVVSVQVTDDQSVVLPSYNAPPIVFLPCDLSACPVDLARGTCVCECYRFSFTSFNWTTSGVATLGANTTAVGGDAVGPTGCRVVSTDAHVAFFPAYLEIEDPVVPQRKDPFSTTEIAIAASVGGVVVLCIAIYCCTRKEKKKLDDQFESVRRMSVEGSSASSGSDVELNRNREGYDVEAYGETARDDAEVMDILKRHYNLTLKSGDFEKAKAAAEGDQI